jgi:hypothetical protein
VVEGQEGAAAGGGREKLGFVRKEKKETTPSPLA